MDGGVRDQVENYNSKLFEFPQFPCLPSVLFSQSRCHKEATPSSTSTFHSRDRGVRKIQSFPGITSSSTVREHPRSRVSVISNVSIDRLFALGMELPEDTFVKVHGYDAVGETYGRPSTPDIDYGTNNLRSPLHEVVRQLCQACGCLLMQTQLSENRGR